MYPNFQNNEYLYADKSDVYFVITVQSITMNLNENIPMVLNKSVSYILW